MHQKYNSGFADLWAKKVVATEGGNRPISDKEFLRTPEGKGYVDCQNWARSVIGRRKSAKDVGILYRAHLLEWGTSFEQKIQGIAARYGFTCLEPNGPRVMLAAGLVGCAMNCHQLIWRFGRE